MERITKAQLNEILAKQAANDMERARQDSWRNADKIGYGSLIVTGTKLGNIELRYYPNRKRNNRYNIYQFNTGLALTPEAGTSVKTITEWFQLHYQVSLIDTVVID